MVLVEDYAKTSALSAEQIIEKIRSGDMVGRKVGDIWYVDSTKINNSASVNGSIGNIDCMNDYRSSIFIGKVISFFGWIGVAISVLVALVAFSSGEQGAFIIGLAICIIGSLLSLIVVAMGQLLRATADNANANKKMLYLMESGK